MNNSSYEVPESFDLSDVAVWLRWIHAVTVGLIMLLSIVGNTATLLLVWKYHQLRYWSILITMGVVLTDLVTPFFLHFQAITSATAGRWPFGDAGCTVFAYISHWLFYVRWLQTAVIALDRFLIIKYPFIHVRWKKRLLMPLVVAGWLVPFATALPPAVGFGSYSFRPQITTCTVECSGDTVCYYFNVCLFSIHFTIGSVTPTLIYLYLFCFGIFKQKKSLQRLGTQNNIHRIGLEANSTAPPQADHNTLNADSEAPSPSQQSETPQPQQQLQTLPQAQNQERSPSPNGLSPAELQRRRRAGTTFAIIFVTLLLTQVPLYMINAVTATPLLAYDDIPVAVHLIAIDVYMLVTALDPILIMRNKDFRQTFSRLMGERRSSWNDILPSSTLTNNVVSQHS